MTFQYFVVLQHDYNGLLEFTVTDLQLCYYMCSHLKVNCIFYILQNTNVKVLLKLDGYIKKRIKDNIYEVEVTQSTTSSFTKSFFVNCADFINLVAYLKRATSHGRLVGPLGSLKGLEKKEKGKK